MRILVVGGGGREHALCWAIATSPLTDQLYCAPGNAGIEQVAKCVPLDASDVDGIVNFAVENKIGLVVVGPEVPLVAGLVDRLDAIGIRAFGPTAAAAALEGSKAFMKELCEKYGIPSAEFGHFDEPDSAKDFIRRKGAPIVVKADGLAAGKGVILCRNEHEAYAAIDHLMTERAFGAAGDEVIIEEFLTGEEASFFALVDGVRAVPLVSAQDHKLAYDGDEGPNTGGMGAYSPAPVVTDELWPFIREEVFGRTLAELKRRGITFKGILYAGLMMTEAGPKVLEFNVRFGDPETQVILPRIAGDLLPAFEACVDGTLSDSLIQWRDEHCVTIVMASGGYPGSYEKGKAITGLAAADGMAGVTVFHAGTAHEGESVVTSGGRVLAVTAVGSDLRSAVELAYTAVPEIRFEGAHYRSDIAARAL